MKAPEFRKAVAVMGRCPILQGGDGPLLRRGPRCARCRSRNSGRSARSSSERERARAATAQVVEANQAACLSLPEDYNFVAYFSKFVTTNTPDPARRRNISGRWSRASPSRRCGIPTREHQMNQDRGHGRHET